MARENNFRETVSSLFQGMDSIMSAKTVVGDAITVGDTTILPLMDISFGAGAGAFGGEKKNNDGGGIGGKMTPNIKNQSNLNKVLDMVPDIVNKFAPGGNEDEEILTPDEEE